MHKSDKIGREVRSVAGNGGEDHGLVRCAGFLCMCMCMCMCVYVYVHVYVYVCVFACVCDNIAEVCVYLVLACVAVVLVVSRHCFRSSGCLQTFVQQREALQDGTRRRIEEK